MPWPRHDWCSAALPVHLVPGSLTVLDGDAAAIDALLGRLASVNSKRLVLSPAPLPSSVPSTTRWPNRLTSSRPRSLPARP
jgi:hypothetical protein